MKPPLWTEHQKPTTCGLWKVNLTDQLGGKAEELYSGEAPGFSPFHPWLEPEGGPIRELCRRCPPWPQVNQLLILARRPGKGGLPQAAEYGRNLFSFCFLFFCLSLTPRVASLQHCVDHSRSAGI